jgi:hypothetical protein
MYQFTETECFITFSFACEDLNEGHPYYVYYSKVTGEKMIITYGLFDDDLTFAKYPPNLAMATDSEQFICSFDAYTLIEQVEEAKTKKMDDDNKKRFSTLVNKIKEIDETDNPVIVLYTLKKF